MQQSAIKSSGAGTTPGLPTQKPTVSQIRSQPQGVIVTNAQAQINLTTPPSAQTQRSATQAGAPLNQGLPRSAPNQPVQYQPLTWPPKSTVATPVPLATPSAVVVPLNQGLHRSLPNQPVQYQPMVWPPKPTAPVQNAATAVPALVPPNQLQKGSQGAITPAQPANQYMWVPASAIQQNMPVVYVNPVAPSLQGQPMLVNYPQAGQLIPQQAPVLLMTSQPSSTSRLPRTTVQTAVTAMGRSGKGVLPVSNRPSAGTVTTFSVLPQSVGQSAVQSAQRQDVGRLRQSPAASSSLPTSSKPPVVASFPQSVPIQVPSAGLPPTSSLQQSSPSSFTTAVSSQRLPNAALSSPDDKSQSELSYQTTSAQSQVPSTDLPLNSSLHQSLPPSRTTASLTQRLPDTVVRNSNGGRQSQESLSGSQRSKESDDSVLVANEGDTSTQDLNAPLRRAGRTITWHYRTQGKSKLQEQRKSLAKDLRG